MKLSLRRTTEYLLYVIIFLLPWQAVWLWREPYVGGFKWEYGVVGIYGMDILIVLFLVLSLVEYCRVYNFQFSPPAGGFNFKTHAYRQAGIFNDSISKFKKNTFYQLLVTSYGLLFLSLLSILWSPDKILAFYFSFKLILAIGLFWTVRRISFDWNKLIFVLLVAGALQGALGIGQFLTQETFSSKWLGTAEHLSQEGGASVVENASGRWLRAYGTFQHPNILGGYLTIVLLIIIWKETNTKKQEPNNIQYSIFNNQSRLKKITSYGLLVTSYVLIISGLIVSFSRSAWLVFTIGFVILFLMQKKRIRELGKIAVILAGVALIWIIAFSPLFFSRLEGQARLEQKSLNDRQEYVVQAKEIIAENFWLGTGAGNYTKIVAEKNPALPIWQIQPVHNVFLLIWAELGVAGLLLLLIFVGVVFMEGIKRNKALVILLYASCFMLYVVDHWLWTSHFGLIFFFLTIGTIFKQIRN